jgi:hypothetical protein
MSEWTLPAIHISSVDCVKAEQVPPTPLGELLSCSALTQLDRSTSMAEPTVGYVLTLRYGRVRLTPSAHLYRMCKRLSHWFYAHMGF